MFNAVKQYRWKELALFIIPFIILLMEMTQLLLARLIHAGSLNPQAALTPKFLPTISGLVPVLGIIVALFITNVALSIFFPKSDQMLLPLVGILSGIGVLMALRIGPSLPAPLTDPSLGIKQLIWVIVGLAVLMVTLALLRNVRWLNRFKYILLLIGLTLVGITLVHASRVNLNSPTHDQLNFGPLSLQPSEFLKIIIVIVFAGFLSERRDTFSSSTLKIAFIRLPVPKMKDLGPLAVMLVLALLLFFGIRELGLALLIYGIFVCMIYLGSGHISYAVASLAIFAILVYVGFLLSSHIHILGYIPQRFQTLSLNIADWQNWTASQQNFASNGGLQIVQGIIALSSGGVLGAGLGLGHPTFVPVVQSDMIFTALGEELGLAGLFGIIAIYLLILYRGYRIAIQASDYFTQLLAAGLTSIFAIQTIIIIAANMNFFPLTGIPLPFLSYGGSSLIANYIIIGILMRISHNTALEKESLGEV
jgi:cell division protein FtsW (lipid II flippase)